MQIENQEPREKIIALKNQLESANQKAKTWKKLARELRDKIKGMETDFEQFKNVWLDCLIDCADYRTRHTAMMEFFHFLQEVIPLTDDEWKKVEKLVGDLLKEKRLRKKEDDHV